MFYPLGTEVTVGDEQREFFRELQDPDGDFTSGREPVSNLADFKPATNLVIADPTPERKFVRELCGLESANAVDAWLKNAPVGFYSIE